MKFVLYSDIHAQMPQLEAVQAAVDAEKADKEVVIGDLLMLGPSPSEVVDNIRARPNTDVVVGNLDLWVTQKRWETHEPRSPHQAWMFEMAKQTRDLLSDVQLHWLSNLPFSITYSPEQGHDFFIFHGTPYDIEFGIDNDLDFPSNVIILQVRPESVWSKREALAKTEKKKDAMERIVGQLIMGVRIK